MCACTGDDIKIVFPSLLAFLMIAGGVSAVVVILVISVNALITVPEKIQFPASLIGEENSKILFIVNSTVSDIINISSICDNPHIFSAIIQTPTGSNSIQFDFKNNGTTFITPNLTIGNVVLKKRSLVQGLANCTLSFGTTPNTNITFVSELA